MRLEFQEHYEISNLGKIKNWMAMIQSRRMMGQDQDRLMFGVRFGFAKNSAKS